MIELNKILQGDCIEGLKNIPDKSVDCCVTSPPYFGLRDYGTTEQIGLEETPELFIEKLTEVFTEVKRILKKEGTLWLNLGDSYWGGKGQSATQSPEEAVKRNKEGLAITSEHQQLGGKGYTRPTDKKHLSIKPKDLVGIPWMVAFALRSSGWYLRQDIIWHKPNPMPESVTDRCTKSHEYIFLMSKSKQYYYDADAIKTPILEDKGPQTFGGKKARESQMNGGDPRNGHRSDKNSQLGKVWKPKGYEHRGTGDQKLTGHSGNFDSDGNLIGDGMANKKSVWTVTTKPFSEAHFATFPQDLIVDCIKAGCPEFVCNKCGRARERIVENEYKIHENWYGDKSKESKHSRGKAGNSYKEKIGINQVGFTDCGCNAGFSPGIVLDPFMGAGTTALVSRKLNRNFIGFELNPEYIKIAEKRLQNELGMFI